MAGFWLGQQLQMRWLASTAALRDAMTEPSTSFSQHHDDGLTDFLRTLQ